MLTDIEIMGYQLSQGTSMAAPYVTGVAALMYQINPSLRTTIVKQYICSSGNVNVLDAPETVTLTVSQELLEKGVFRYSVHDYKAHKDATAKGLSISNAQVKVYKGNHLVECYNVPPNKSGSMWHVFELDQNGIKAVNKVYGAYADQAP